MPTDRATEVFETVDRKTKFVAKSDNLKQMERDAIKALKNMEGRYNLDVSTLN
jgi:hypothetical protein